MGQLIAPDEVPLWIPGELTLNSATAGWEHVALKGYRYGSLDVAIPSMRDYMIVSYKGSDAMMSRRAGGPWRSEQVGRGVCSLLTRGESSQWKWDRPIDVTHIYVAQTELCRVAEDVFEHSISDVGMEDCVRVEDSILPSLASAFEEELTSGGLGGNLYRSALVNQLCIHLLRRYAKARVREVPLAVRMADWQRRRLVQFIEDNLDRNFKLEEMAGEVGVSVSGLIRKFRAEFGCSPHAYVLRQRLERARQLLSRPVATPLKCIATDCGFSDQSHLVRHFKRAFEQTPADYRSTVTGRPLPPPEPDPQSR
ncbi:HTH-type transcriptional regulator ChbR [Pandoraea eparura]|uniref:HTH-type transcriptional regulator ChbR n=1 Tax=Pandoraea eparura TaxID=2508291 RepID=A0A5E4RGB6_9BURK|nr:AraC family transcriptional regulator [Pandoraea eparura]VVD62360.1 HTH-type transcriptional regulator ChbR [Pandoraea eparura]